MKLRACIESYFNSDAEIRSSAGELLGCREINEQFLSILAALREQAQPGDIVGIRLPNDERYFLTLLGCMYLGLTYVPMSIKWPEKRIEQLSQICGLAHVLDEDWFQENVRPTSQNMQSGWSDLENETLYIMYTSGSTGEPKGVEIPRTAYENFIGWVDGEFTAIESKHRLLAATDFTFDVSLMDVAVALTKKVAVYFFDFQANVFRMLSEITNHQINVLATVPNNLQMLLDPHVVSRGNVESLKFLFVAGSRFSTGLYEILDAYKDQISVYNCYGPTEATIYCVFSHLFQAAHDLNSECVTIGKALPGCQAEVISPEGQPVAQGERGELVIGGHQLMAGYRNRADLTEAAFVDVGDVRFYKTGDVCFRDAHDQYFVVGRIDDTIKTAGFRVNLSNIDSYISQLDAVQASGTIAVAHPQKENILVSYIVANPGATDASIRAELQKVLNPYQVPSKIMLVENLPVTTSGKIAKRELLARYEEAKAS